MNFKKFFTENGIPFPRSDIMECIINERIDDDAFRKKAMNITNFLIENITMNKSYFFNDLGLYVDFQVLPKAIKANYNLNFDMITINIMNSKELFESDFPKFLIENKYSIFHEVIHFIDYHRGSKYRASLQGSLSNVNTPMEFNAYFHHFIQLTEDLIKEIAKSKDRNEAFEELMGKRVHEFIAKFWENAKVLHNDKDTKIITDIFNDNDWKFKWDKRLYQYYFEAKEKLLDKANVQQIKSDIKTSVKV